MSFSKQVYQSFSWRLGYYISLFVLNICISRYFQSVATGWFNYTISICSLLILAVGFSLDSAIGYFVARGNFRIDAISGFIFSWAIVAALIATPLAFMGYRSDYLSTSDSNLLWGTCLFIVGNLFITMLQAVFYAQRDFRFSNAVGVIFNVLLMGVLVLRHSLDQRISIFEFLQLYGISFFLQGLIFGMVLQQRNKIRLFRGFDLPAIRLLFRYASLVFTSNLVFFLVYRIDYWFVNKYCNEDLLGNYIQAAKLVQVFLILPASIANVIFSNIAGGNIDLSDRLKRLSRLMVGAFAGVLILLGLTGRWLFPFLFGPSFDKMYSPFLLLVPGIICLTIIALLGAYFGGKNLARVNLTGALIALGFMIAGDLVLIPRFQINGAAIASSISYASYLVYMLNWFNKNEAKGIIDFFICTKQDLQYLRSFILTKRIK